MIVDPDFPDHWKTRTLVGLLGDEAAPVYVLRLWAHCQNRRQFRFDGLSSEALKALCRFPGPANKLEASLVTSGFVRRESSDFVVVGWDEYNKSLIASWDNGRKGGRPPTNKSANQSVTPDSSENPTGLPGNGQHETHGIPTGKPTGIPTGSREEKRGIEKSREEKTIPPKPPKGGSMTCQEFFDRWNKYASARPKLKTCRKLTKERSDKIRKRLALPGWFDDFIEAVKVLPIADDGWQPDLDWLIKNEKNVYRILEGAFEWRTKDDPALQKLEKDKRRRAAQERQKELEQQKRQEKQDALKLRNAIDSTLPQTNGNGEDKDESSLLFG